MNSYNKKAKKTNILTWVIGEAIFIFIIATASIVLYDMYINIDVTGEEMQIAKKETKEVVTDIEEDISDTLEEVSKSVVRDIKNNNK